MSVGHAIAFARGKVGAARSLTKSYIRQVPVLGLLPATALFAAEASSRRPLARITKPFVPARLTLRPSGYRYPITVRRLGTDLAVLRQMLVTEEYKPVGRLPNVRVVVDCGANIGLSAYYLLHCYPNARLVAVEPEAENCALCRKNLAPFGDRACVIQAAIWPRNEKLRIVPSSRAKGSWALQVEAWAGGDIEGLTLDEIMQRAQQLGPIDLLKIDIEGAEGPLFEHVPRWLDIVRNIAIELHDEEAEANLTAALLGYTYARVRAHELTIFLSIVRPREPVAGPSGFIGRPA